MNYHSYSKYPQDCLYNILLKEASKKWSCPDCEPTSEPSTMIDLLRALTEEVKQMRVRLQGIDELKEIKETLNKQADISFENSEKLNKIENLLEEQKKEV